MKSNKQSFRRPVPTLLACALASCLMIAAPAAFAQSTSATLRGVVTADSTPAANAVVTATNLANGYTSHVTANADGSYVLAGLQPGAYRIDVTTGGKTSSQTVTLAVGQSISLDLLVSTAANLGEVNAVGVATAETKTSELATYISQKQLDALPQGSRNFLAFADLVPGMQFITNADGSTQVRGGAQSSNGTNVFIDGVGQKNYVLKGGISSQDSSRGNPFPQLGIAEYKVITQNYKAEYDQLSGAAITAVTRSGSNEFHGEAFFDYTSDSLREPTPREQSTGVKLASQEKQYGFSFGGPIIQDRMHFFLTYEAKDFTEPSDVRLGNVNGHQYTVSELPAALQPLVTGNSQPFNEDLFFGKLDWTAGDNGLFELTGKYRQESQLVLNTGPDTLSRATDKKNDETRIDLRYQYSAERWLNDAHLTYEDAYWNPRPTTLADGYLLTGQNPWETILNAGGSGDYQNKGQKGTSLQDDLTFTDLQWHGSHIVKMGFKYKDIQIDAFEQQPYNPQLYFDINQSTSVPYQVQFGATIPGVERNVRSNNTQFGAYLQDDWEVNDHLTLNLGMRWDYEKTPGYLNFVTRPDLAAALRAWPNVNNSTVDYNIEDYISNGHNRKSFKDAWQPRVGFSYDIDGDQRRVVFGGAGRSYDRNLFDYLALETSKGTFPTYTYRFNTPGHACDTVNDATCLTWDPKYADPAVLAALVAANPQLGGEVNLMNNNLKTPYSDQFSLGMRNAVELGGQTWNTTVTLSHVESHDGIVFALGNRYPGGTFRDPNCVGATWGCQPWGYGIPGFGTLIIATNGIETRADSLLLQAEKPYSKDSPWGVTLAYTYTDGKENRSNAASSDEHYLFDYSTVDQFGWKRSTGVPKHRFVATGFADQWGFTFSGKLVLASQVARDTVNCSDAASWNNCFFDPYYAKGTIGFKQVDLAVQKVFALGGDAQLRIRLDVLNVFNWRNWTDFDGWRGGPGETNPTFGSRNGDGITVPTRTLKLTAGFSW
jgi:outer membrane receptor protein involved in Fe transport